MQDKQAMTPEEVATLKEEINMKIDEVLGSGDLTKGDAINAICESVEMMKEEPDMGGMGEVEEGGMELPEDGMDEE